LFGDCGVGAVTFSVAPLAGVTAAGVGVVGVSAFDFEHARDNDKAMSEAVLRTVSVLCCIFTAPLFGLKRIRRAGS
jgi:hypothetical protein